MFAKVLILCVVAAAMAIEYPPGVNPLTCPDYPYCREMVYPRFAINPLAYGLRYPYTYVRSLPIETVKVDPAKYPADVDPALCPNYPYCS